MPEHGLHIVALLVIGLILWLTRPAARDGAKRIRPKDRRERASNKSETPNESNPTSRKHEKLPTQAVLQ